MTICFSQELYGVPRACMPWARIHTYTRISLSLYIYAIDTMKRLVLYFFSFLFDIYSCVWRARSGIFSYFVECVPTLVQWLRCVVYGLACMFFIRMCIGRSAAAVRTRMRRGLRQPCACDIRSSLEPRFAFPPLCTSVRICLCAYLLAREWVSEQFGRCGCVTCRFTTMYGAVSLPCIGNLLSMDVFVCRVYEWAAESCVLWPMPFVRARLCVCVRWVANTWIQPPCGRCEQWTRRTQESFNCIYACTLALFLLVVFTFGVHEANGRLWNFEFSVHFGRVHE